MENWPKSIKSALALCSMQITVLQEIMCLIGNLLSFDDGKSLHKATAKFYLEFVSYQFVCFRFCILITVN